MAQIRDERAGENKREIQKYELYKMYLPLYRSFGGKMRCFFSKMA